MTLSTYSEIKYQSRAPLELREKSSQKLQGCEDIPTAFSLSSCTMAITLTLKNWCCKMLQSCWATVAMGTAPITVLQKQTHPRLATALLDPNTVLCNCNMSVSFLFQAKPTHCSNAWVAAPSFHRKCTSRTPTLHIKRHNWMSQSLTRKDQSGYNNEETVAQKVSHSMELASSVG